MKAFIRHLKWLWQVRHCQHTGERRLNLNLDRFDDGPSWRCVTCDRVVR